MTDYRTTGRGNRQYGMEYLLRGMTRRYDMPMVPKLLIMTSISCVLITSSAFIAASAQEDERSGKARNSVALIKIF